MIINGGSRRNGRFFAKHLSNTRDNDRVRVVEVRGLFGVRNLGEAFAELEDMGRGVEGCKNSFYHANLNPREGELLTDEQWNQAVDILEAEQGLTGQPRIVVEHEKNGRVHRHACWSRIDTDSMSVISDSHNYAKNAAAARKIEALLGLEPVPNILGPEQEGPRPGRRPKDFEGMRASTTGLDIAQVESDLAEVWRGTDSAEALAAGLEEKGYLLCQGRKLCVVDPAGKDHSLGRRLSNAGVRDADIKARFSGFDLETLPSVSEAKATAGELLDGESVAAEKVRDKQFDAEISPYIRQLKQGTSMPAPLPFEDWLAVMSDREARRVVADAINQHKREDLGPWQRYVMEREAKKSVEIDKDDGPEWSR